MPPESLAIPSLLNYDSAVDWRRRLAREGPFLLAFRADLALDSNGIATVTERAFHVVSSADGEPADPRLLHERLRYLQGWRHGELLTLLDVARFREIRCHGGFAGEPFDLDLSEELVLVAR